MSWGNDWNNEPPRRKYRDRFGADEDIFGAADAEDHFDDGSGNDLTFGQHAAGLDYDQGYDQRYADRQGYNDPYYGYPPQQPPPYPPQSPPMPNRADQLRERMSRRPEVYQPGKSGSGIDNFFDAKPSLSKLPCSNSIFLMLFVFIAIMVCLVMAFLAAGSLTRLLGI